MAALHLCEMAYIKRWDGWLPDRGRRGMDSVAAYLTVKHPSTLDPLVGIFPELSSCWGQQCSCLGESEGAGAFNLLPMR